MLNFRVSQIFLIVNIDKKLSISFVFFINWYLGSNLASLDALDNYVEVSCFFDIVQSIYLLQNDFRLLDFAEKESWIESFYDKLLNTENDLISLNDPYQVFALHY